MTKLYQAFSSHFNQFMANYPLRGDPNYLQELRNFFNHTSILFPKRTLSDWYHLHGVLSYYEDIEITFKEVSELFAALSQIDQRPLSDGQTEEELEKTKEIEQKCLIEVALTARDVRMTLEKYGPSQVPYSTINAFYYEMAKLLVVSTPNDDQAVYKKLMSTRNIKGTFKPNRKTPKNQENANDLLKEPIESKANYGVSILGSPSIVPKKKDRIKLIGCSHILDLATVRADSSWGIQLAAMLYGREEIQSITKGSLALNQLANVHVLSSDEQGRIREFFEQAVGFELTDNFYNAWRKWLETKVLSIPPYDMLMNLREALRSGDYKHEGTNDNAAFETLAAIKVFDFYWNFVPAEIKKRIHCFERKRYGSYDLFYSLKAVLDALVGHSARRKTTIQRCIDGVFRNVVVEVADNNSCIYSRGSDLQKILESLNASDKTFLQMSILGHLALQDGKIAANQAVENSEKAANQAIENSKIAAIEALQDSRKQCIEAVKSLSAAMEKITIKEPILFAPDYRGLQQLNDILQRCADLKRAYTLLKSNCETQKVQLYAVIEEHRKIFLHLGLPSVGQMDPMTMRYDWGSDQFHVEACFYNKSTFFNSIVVDTFYEGDKLFELLFQHNKDLINHYVAREQLEKEQEAIEQKTIDCIKQLEALLARLKLSQNEVMPAIDNTPFDFAAMYYRTFASNIISIINNIQTIEGLIEIERLVLAGHISLSESATLAFNRVARQHVDSVYQLIMLARKANLCQSPKLAAVFLDKFSIHVQSIEQLIEIGSVATARPLGEFSHLFINKLFELLRGFDQAERSAKLVKLAEMAGLQQIPGFTEALLTELPLLDLNGFVDMARVPHLLKLAGFADTFKQRFDALTKDNDMISLCYIVNSISISLDYYDVNHQENASVSQQNAENESNFFNLIKDLLPNFVDKSIQDFSNIMHALSHFNESLQKIAMTYFFHAMIARLPGLVQSGSDLALIQQYLTAEQKVTLYLAINTRLPELIQSKADFDCMHRFLTGTTVSATFINDMIDVVDDKFTPIYKGLLAGETNFSFLKGDIIKEFNAIQRSNKGATQAKLEKIYLLLNRLEDSANREAIAWRLMTYHRNNYPLLLLRTYTIARDMSIFAKSKSFSAERVSDEEDWVMLGSEEIQTKSQSVTFFGKKTSVSKKLTDLESQLDEVAAFEAQCKPGSRLGKIVKQLEPLKPKLVPGGAS